MTDPHTEMLEALGRLIDLGHLAPPAQLPTVVQEAFEVVGWTVTIYLADFDQRILRPIGTSERFEPQSIDGTLAGRCFRHSAPTHAHRPTPHSWIPLIDGVDRLGVLRLELPAGVSIEEPAVAAHVRWAAHLIGHMIASKSASTDVFDSARLNGERTVASEMIWSMLPPLTVAAEGIAIAGGLQPSHTIAGDVFDYAIDERVAHLAIVDATGHDLTATLIAAVVLAAYRSERRRQAGLPATIARIDQAMEASGPDTYASGIFAELDMQLGTFRYSVTGHPAPLLMRDGKVVKSLDGGRRILLGFPDHESPVAAEVLEPGDWIVLYTDGVIEARDTEGHMFGIERLTSVLQRCAADRQNAAESIRRIMQQVLEHQHGVLQDDATIVLVQWMTTFERELEAT